MKFLATDARGCTRIFIALRWDDCPILAMKEIRVHPCASAEEKFS